MIHWMRCGERAGNGAPGMGERIEHFLIEAFVSELAIEAVDEAVPLRLSHRLSPCDRLSIQMQDRWGSAQTAADFRREIHPVPETETQLWRQSPPCVGLCAGRAVLFSVRRCGWRRERYDAQIGSFSVSLFTLNFLRSRTQMSIDIGTSQRDPQNQLGVSSLVDQPPLDNQSTQHSSQSCS